MNENLTPDELNIIKKYEAIERGRDLVIEQLVEDKTDTLKSKVAWLLNHFPETRNSDKTLTIKYIEEFHSDLVINGKIGLAALYDLPAFRDIARKRQLMQGTYNLFLPTKPEILAQRRQLHDELREEYSKIAEQQQINRVHVFIDESGKTDKTLFVGSVWVYGTSVEVNGLLEEIHKYRSDVGYSREWHFTKLSKNEVPVYKGLIDLLISKGAMVSFKVAYIPRQGYRGQTEKLVEELTEEILVSGIHEEHTLGRAPLPRHLEVLFDAQDNWIGAEDALKAKRLHEALENASNSRFDGRLSMSRPTPADSQSHELLQIADLVAASASRLKNHPGDHYKAEFASYFLSQLGLSVPSDEKIIQSDIGSHINILD